ncbi:hypothetical protein IC582_019569 [Cucumis melo]
MAFKIPGCNIHASTIDGRIKLMKRMFHALVEMRGPMCSGFGWNDEKNASSQRKKSLTIGSRVIRRRKASLISRLSIMTNYRTCLAKIVQQKVGPRVLRTLGQTILLGMTHLSIEYENEQLNHIAEWPVLQRQDASQTRQEVVRQLEAIPELTLMDRCRLMRILMRNVDDMKAFLKVPDNMKYPYCSIILQENR